MQNPPIQFDEEELVEVLRDLKPGKAPGEFTGTYEMIQAAAFGSPAGLHKCCTFINAMLKFDMPRVLSLVNSKRIPFEKTSQTTSTPWQYQKPRCVWGASLP